MITSAKVWVEAKRNFGALTVGLRRVENCAGPTPAAVTFSFNHEDSVVSMLIRARKKVAGRFLRDLLRHRKEEGGVDHPRA